jgi:hypothetical protein
VHIHRKRGGLIEVKVRSRPGKEMKWTFAIDEINLIVVSVREGYDDVKIHGLDIPADCRFPP